MIIITWVVFVIIFGGVLIWKTVLFFNGISILKEEVDFIFFNFFILWDFFWVFIWGLFLVHALSLTAVSVLQLILVLMIMKF